MTHTLPSTAGDPLSEFTAHFKSAHFTRSGECNVTFTLAKDQAVSVLDLNENDGMALNVTVWGTELPDAMELGLGGLVAGLGLGRDEDE